MKTTNTSQKIRACLLAGALASSPVSAADPQPAPDIQALMALLNKLAAEAAVETTPDSETAPAPAAPTPAQKSSTASQPASSALRTGGLTTSSLATSTALGERGAGAALRLTEDVWRALFPVRTTPK